MDKWGWSLCPTGKLLVGLNRDGPYDNGEIGDALFNIQTAICRSPAEGRVQDVASGDGTSVELGHCYHENWWSKFDSKGGAFCRQNYFVAGLFRSHCNSLYCLEMVKCCQVKRALWNDCKWVDMSTWKFKDPVKKATKYAMIEAHSAGPKGFIAGFYRGTSHTLDGMQYMRQCVPVFVGGSSRD